MNAIQKMNLLALKGMIMCIRALPRSAVVKAGRLFGLLTLKAFPLHGKIARVQMRQALGERFDEEILRESFMHQGGLFADEIKLAYMDEHELKGQVIAEGREHFDKARTSGRPILVVTGHTNWEILGHTPRVFGFELCVMGDYIKNPAVQAIADEIRALSGIRVRPPKGGMVDRYVNELKDGHIVGMIIDQRGRRENRLFCDVMGMPAPTNPAPALIALRADALVLPIAGIRQPDGRYVFRWHEAIDSRDFGADHHGKTLSNAWTSSAVKGLSTAMHTWVSSVILEHPGQWFWLHCRWARRSDMKKIVRKGLNFREYVTAQAEGYLL